MIGCMAKAKSDALHMDDTEMDDVRWISKADVKKALERSSAADNPLTGETPPLSAAVERPASVLWSDQHQCLEAAMRASWWINQYCMMVLGVPQ